MNNNKEAIIGAFAARLRTQYGVLPQDANTLSAVGAKYTGDVSRLLPALAKAYYTDDEDAFVSAFERYFTGNYEIVDCPENGVAGDPFVVVYTATPLADTPTTTPEEAELNINGYKPCTPEDAEAWLTIEPATSEDWPWPNVSIHFGKQCPEKYNGIATPYRRCKEWSPKLAGRLRILYYSDAGIVPQLTNLSGPAAKVAEFCEGFFAPEFREAAAAFNVNIGGGWIIERATLQELREMGEANVTVGSYEIDEDAYGQ